MDGEARLGERFQDKCIHVYSIRTCNLLWSYRGHNGRVRSVIWSPDDQRLVTAGADGAVYEWRLQDFKREKENVLKVWSATS